MTEPAKLGAENLILSRLNRREMHMDSKAGHRVLLEAHARNEETMYVVERAQDHFNLAVHWYHHRSRHDIVFGRGFFRIEAKSRFAAGRGIFQLRVRGSTLVVRSWIAETPGELHPRHFHAHSIRFCC